MMNIIFVEKSITVIVCPFILKGISNNCFDRNRLGIKKSEKTIAIIVKNQNRSINVFKI
jgi:hypothetical protein